MSSSGSSKNISSACSGIKCSMCNKSKLKNMFSNSQLKKNASKRKCKHCIQPEKVERYLQLIQSEKKALNILLQKKNDFEKEIESLESSKNDFIFQTKLPENNIPLFNTKDYDKAVKEEERRKSRAEARGESYVQSERNSKILLLPSIIKNIEKKNREIKEKNSIIEHQNDYVKKERTIILRKIDSFLNKIGDIKCYLEECEKNIRYLDYANKYGLDIDMESLIDICNSHRNNYIAKTAYETWRLQDDDDPPGYSKCYKSYYDCDNNMYYDDYNYASCECGYSTWELNVTPDSKHFDITSTTVDGNHSGYSYFSVRI